MTFSLEADFSSCSDSSIEREVLFVCRQVLEVFHKRIPKGPCLGYKPIVLVKDDVPRAATNGLPEKYIVSLTCLHTRRFNQLVYQFAHELTHVYISPYISQPFVEILAVSVSLVLLKDMHALWRSIENLKMRSYAQKYLQYRNQIVSLALERSNLRLELQLSECESNQNSDESESKRQLAQIQNWVQQNLVFTELDLHDRNMQIVASLLVEEILECHSTWNALTLFQAGHIDVDMLPCSYKLEMETNICNKNNCKRPLGKWYTQYDDIAWEKQVSKSPNGEATLVQAIITAFTPDENIE